MFLVQVQARTTRSSAARALPRRKARLGLWRESAGPGWNRGASDKSGARREGVARTGVGPGRNPGGLTGLLFKNTGGWPSG